MILLPVVLFLTAILLPSCGDAQSISFESLSTEREETQHEIVNKHNALRAQASPPAANMLQMKWSEEAQKSAQDWANKCTLRHSDVHSRTIGSICGENLFMSTTLVPWSKAIQAWYDEVEYFVFGKGSTSTKPVGHYTQVMWYSSHKIGCGLAECPNASYKYFFVCHYCPAGNVMPRENSPYEIGTPCAKCPESCSNNLCTNPCEYTDGVSNCPQLKQQFSCNNPSLKKYCKASCQCINKIY